MDEEHNNRDLEDKLYAMLHHTDETQVNIDTNLEKSGEKIVVNAPRSSVRRYWKVGVDQNSAQQKGNKTKEYNISRTAMKESKNNEQKPKEEKCDIPNQPAEDDLLFQLPPQHYIRTIEIIDHENENKVVIETSDEDEVVEVKLPPKPTITIESSDDEVCVVSDQSNTINKKNKPKQPPENKTSKQDREISASPVPSVVSSVSDEFIRSDCIALNISSKKPDNHSFDFSLHGSDLLEHTTPSKKMKKKKKAKEVVTSTRASTPEKPSNDPTDTCFATPKNKTKKKQKNKSYKVSEKCVPNADVYDSDSNQSVIESNSEQKPGNVAQQNSDVSQSNLSLEDPLKNNPKNDLPRKLIESSKSKISENPEAMPITIIDLDETNDSVVDFTENVNETPIDGTTSIKENIVMGNVTGNTNSDSSTDGNNPETSSVSNPSRQGSTNVPEILNEDLDFVDIKGHMSRRYSTQKLRADMQKFYNDSWGGEQFNHWELLKSMPRDAHLWEIDARDRFSLPISQKKRMICAHCNRPGHRYEACRLKRKVCHMCGTEGHTDTTCPGRVCLGCGSKNEIFTRVCGNCAHYRRMFCEDCGQRGHPRALCPDHWRRYHNTIGSGPLVEDHSVKDRNNMWCSGCAKRGHLVHECRYVGQWSPYVMTVPWVVNYYPMYRPERPLPRDTTRKRHSPSPRPMHPTKKNFPGTGIAEISEANRTDARPRQNPQIYNVPAMDARQRQNPQAYNEPARTTQAGNKGETVASNRDNKGRMIQDNEVSDTSEVVTTARVYLTKDVIEKLKSEEGAAWLEAVTDKYDVVVNLDGWRLNIVGKTADQEAVHEDLRELVKRDGPKKKPKVKPPTQKYIDGEEEEFHDHYGIPKRKESAIRILKQALESLNADLGEPLSLHERLVSLQNRQQTLRRQTSVDLEQLAINRDKIHQISKNLNMILIGKAQLADGAVHMTELHNLIEKLTNLRQNTISKEIRSNIGMHYHPIFSSYARIDYQQLLNMYQPPKRKLQPKKDNKKAKNKKKNKAAVVKINNVPPPDPETKDPPADKTQDKKKRDPPPGDQQQKQQLNAEISRLKSYRNKIFKSRPQNKLKIKRLVLAVKLKKQINHLQTKQEANPQMMSKNRRLHQQAQEFLDNVN